MDDYDDDWLEYRVCNLQQSSSVVVAAAAAATVVLCHQPANTGPPTTASSKLFNFIYVTMLHTAIMHQGWFSAFLGQRGDRPGYLVAI